MSNKEICVKRFREVCQKYGFSTITLGDKEVLVAKNTDNEDVNWIAYDTEKDTVSFSGNTDYLNLWFCETRKDLTPDKIVEFLKDLNEALDLEGDKILVKELIDPEDWQEIADMSNAYEDLRYASL